MPDHHRPDQEQVIIPIGIIKEPTEDGISIRLIPPLLSADKLQPQANILTRDSGTGTHARATVRVGNPSATWPGSKSWSLRRSRIGRKVNPLATGQPVYLALPDSFDPDPDQQGSEEESEPFSEVPGTPPQPLNPPSPQHRTPAMRQHSPQPHSSPEGPSPKGRICTNGEGLSRVMVKPPYAKGEEEQC